MRRSVPPSFGALVSRFESAQRAENERAPFRSSPIEVRRFAGPTAYLEHVEHLRVVHLTDLHVGRITPLRVQLEAARRVNDEEPDLIAITGDFVCHGRRYLDELTAVITCFRAPVVAVLGNHDYWSGAPEVRRALRRAGVEVLQNACTVMTLRHTPFQVVGIDDAYTGHADLRRATEGLRRGLPALGLTHIAEEADGLWACGVPLVLAGHTHGGQVTLARLHELAIGRIAGHRYVHGLYGDRRGEGAVYVGAGIGAAVMPLRVGDRARREVTVFELGHEPGAFTEHHAEQESLPGRPPSEELRARRHAAVQKKRAKYDAVEPRRRTRESTRPPRRGP